MSNIAVKPIPGAARYFGGNATDGKFYVFMVATDGDGGAEAIQTCKTLARANEAAERWQIKENKAVAKVVKAVK